MTDKEKMKLLHNEITDAAIWARSTKGTPYELIFKAYIAGMQYAVSVLAGAKAESILPGKEMHEAS